jgi:hypothetical protein
MRKEKLSYLILFAEIMAIVWLHSVKSAHPAASTPDNLVKVRRLVSPAVPSPNYIQAVRHIKSSTF